MAWSRPPSEDDDVAFDRFCAEQTSCHQLAWAPERAIPADNAGTSEASRMTRAVIHAQRRLARVEALMRTIIGAA